MSHTSAPSACESLRSLRVIPSPPSSVTLHQERPITPQPMPFAVVTCGYVSEKDELYGAIHATRDCGALDGLLRLSSTNSFLPPKKPIRACARYAGALPFSARQIKKPGLSPASYAIT